jgi:hypothetical protein
VRTFKGLIFQWEWGDKSGRSEPRESWYDIAVCFLRQEARPVTRDRCSETGLVQEYLAVCLRESLLAKKVVGFLLITCSLLDFKRGTFRCPLITHSQRFKN